MRNITIKTALISVFHKDGLEPILEQLQAHGVRLLSTGGTASHLESLGYEVDLVEDVTGYPSILGGRVKTLHPGVFGGILSKREDDGHRAELKQHDIHEIDLVIVDLYPFAQTLADGGTEAELIEKIDIGGISLIRAAAKNRHDVLIVSSQKQYAELTQMLKDGNGVISQEDRQRFAAAAFAESAGYDALIAQWMQGNQPQSFHVAAAPATVLRYGENPHQEGIFFGSLEKMFTQHAGKALSFNNLVDIDAALQLLYDLRGERRAAALVIKHTNTCGLALRSDALGAYQAALAGDPISAFGGIVALNRRVTLEVAQALNELFFEVLIAPGYDTDALDLLTLKKKRIVLELTPGWGYEMHTYRSVLGGVLQQDRDDVTDWELTYPTERKATEAEEQDLRFANLAVKHLKSNGIALVKHEQLIGMGAGQTSRIDALNQAINKARHFGFDLDGCVMASDAFFPFSDCAEVAGDAGVKAIIQPGGSIRDSDSVRACNERGMAMAMTSRRHFRH